MTSSAQAEAARCLACGICSECMSCVFACGVNAIDHDMVARDRDACRWAQSSWRPVTRFTRPSFPKSMALVVTRM